jgi:predicted nucleotidyltransferase
LQAIIKNNSLHAIIILMDAPSSNLTPQQMAVYHATAKRRQRELQAQMAQLSGKAWEDAKRAAEILRGRFHVSQVVVFGSLVHEGCFTRWSDIDIAAWGIAPEDTLRAIGAIMDMEANFVVNLVDINIARSSLVEIIEKEGVAV